MTGAESTEATEANERTAASSEAMAAERLLIDPDVDVALGVEHLRSAWTRVAGASEAIVERAEEIAAQRVDPQERDAFVAAARWVAEEVDATMPERGALLAMARTLIERPEPAPPDPVRRLGVVLVIAVLMSMLGGAAWSILRGPTGPWRGLYYDNQTFEGRPRLEYARRVEFDWEKQAPGIRGLGKNRWSATWDTCMTVEEDTTIRFRVTSDDGSRVYVDDEMVVDNWGAHATRTRSGSVEVEAGVHYLRVEYFEASHTANIKVLAAFGEGEDPESIPPQILSQPTNEQKETKTPCS